MRREDPTYWELIPSREPPLVLDGRLHVFRGIASRNIDSARRRRLRPQVASIAEEPDPITLEDGATPQVPSDDENVPDLPDGALSLRPPYG